MKPVLQAICSIVSLYLSVATAQASQFVVVEARGIGLKAGTVIDSNKPLHLSRGQHVRVISEDGTTLKVDGPFDKALASGQAEGVDVVSALAALGTERKSRLGDVGTTRGVQTQLPEPWILNASYGGNECLREGQAVTFWRPDAAKAVNFWIMPADRSWRLHASWPAGVDRLPLHDIAVHADASYLVSLDGAVSAIYVNTVPALLSNDQMRAAWMADKGCEAQAKALLSASR